MERQSKSIECKRSICLQCSEMLRMKTGTISHSVQRGDFDPSFWADKSSNPKDSWMAGPFQHFCFSFHGTSWVSFRVYFRLRAVGRSTHVSLSWLISTDYFQEYLDNWLHWSASFNILDSASTMRITMLPAISTPKMALSVIAKKLNLCLVWPLHIVPEFSRPFQWLYGKLQMSFNMSFLQ